MVAGVIVGDTVLSILWHQQRSALIAFSSQP